MEEPIIVNGKIVPKHMMDKVMEEDFKFETTTIRPKLSTSKFREHASLACLGKFSNALPICFQIIKHRSLLHSSFYTIQRAVTKNECR